MSLDGQHLAGLKNRLGKTQLTSELFRIEREEKAEMRMHNTSKQRFKAKYSKLDSYIDRGKDASDVRLYETHNPGFCYRRNGECRTPQASAPGATVDFKDIHALLFTDGEVDIEKVLCLHLLTAHKTESLTPPARYHRTISFLSKEQSPLERLIERSRKKRQEDSVTKILPTYILDVKTRKLEENAEKKEDEVLIRDGRLAARVIINDKIVQLVHTVMAALESSNPEKVNELLKMAKDPQIIRAIVEKPHIQQFLDMLNGQSLVSSCESFHLTQPFKATAVPLELETSSRGLERLVNHIRRNVLRVPAHSTWKTMYQQSQNEAGAVNSLESYKEIKKDAPLLQSQDTTNASSDVLRPSAKTNFIAKNRQAVSKVKTNSAPVPRTPTKKASKIPILKSPRKTSTAAAEENLEKIGNHTMGSKKEELVDREKGNANKSKSEDPKGGEDKGRYGGGIFRGMDIKAVANLVSVKAEKANKRDMAQFQQLSRNPPPEPPPDPCCDSPSQPDAAAPAKVSIKQVTCSACREKWKNPLPNPKVPRSRRVSMPVLDQTPSSDIKSGSAHRLSLMIDEEMKKLSSEERRASKGERRSLPTHLPYRSIPRGSALKRRTLDSVELNVLDLAKITQEIKEKEAQRKLSKFLENQI